MTASPGWMLIGAIATQDVRLVQTDVGLDGLPQQGMVGVGVDMIVVTGGQGLAHFGRGAVGILVGIQLDQGPNGDAQLLAEHLERHDGGIFLQVLQVGPQESPHLEFAFHRITRIYRFLFIERFTSPDPS